MELDVCPEELGLDPDDRDASQYGRIVENRVIEAVETSASRLIESFHPVTDSGGYDWVGVPFGRFDRVKLIQIKGTLHLLEDNGSKHFQIIFDAGALVPHQNTSVVFALFDVDGNRLVDPLWRVPSLELTDVARPYYCKRHRRRHLHFLASVSMTSKDGASRYQVRQDHLGHAIFGSAIRSMALPSELSPVSSEEGDFFESAFTTRFLRDCSGAEKLLRPDTDLGRDVLGLTLQPFHWASLAIKGTAVRSHGYEVIAVLIKERTFVPHRRHFVLVQFFDRPLRRLHGVSWLIPSLAFARLANRSSGMYQFVSSLNPTNNRWARYAIPTEEDAATFMRRMRRPPAA